VSRWSFGKDGKIQVAVSGPLIANNGDMLVAAAIAGQGIVYMPYFLVSSEIGAGLLVPLKLDRPPIELGGIYAVYPSDRHPPAKTRVAVDFFAEAMRAQEWNAL
jgi:DNA-binding transcriptional LysR family regulator